MNILAFDQSLTHSAAVLLESYSSSIQLKLINKAILKPKSSGIYRIMEFGSWIHTLLEEWSVQLLAREMHKQVTRGAGGEAHHLAAHLDAIAYNKGFVERSEYYIIPATSWKKMIFGKGNTAKDTAYLMKLNKSLLDSDWFEGPARMIEDDNEADAISIGITAFITHLYRSKPNLDNLYKYQIETLKKCATFIDYGKQ